MCVCVYIYICIHASPNILKNEMGGACSMHEGEERCVQGFGVET